MAGNITTFDAHLDERHGKPGTKSRARFEIKAKTFLVKEVVADEKLLKSMAKNAGGKNMVNTYD